MATTRTIPAQDSLAGEDEKMAILAARQGDLEAFNQLVRNYQDRIYNLAARILGDEDTAEDITQNTFLTAYLNLRRFRDGSFRGWLYRIATNACYDVYRHQKRHPMMSIENEDPVNEKLSPLDDFSTLSKMPETELERHELEHVVQHALQQLDMDQRSVVTLVDLQGFDYLETAQVLGIKMGTVKSRLARARMRLRQLLSPVVES